MGQQLSFAHDEQLGRSINSRNFKSNTKGIEHEGILRFRSIPFCGSTQIAKSPALFLENADYSLQEILESRLNTTRLLTEDDLLKLLEYVLYTLAYLQSLGVLYKDLVPSNIYYLIDQNAFKLLPPELIENSSFQLMQEGTRFSLISPQMLIALREQQQTIDDETYHKSNVFMLGMIMLEAATLQPSCLCYEDNTLGILDRAIQDRLQLVRRMYPAELAALLKNMLEYDSTIRMNPQQLALYLNQYFSRSNVKCAVVQAHKPYLSTHPNTKINQSQITSTQKSSTRFNNLVGSQNSAYVQQNVNVTRINTDAFSPSPAKVKTGYHQNYTSNKTTTQHLEKLKIPVIPPQVLQYVSRARQRIENPQFSNLTNLTPPKKQLNEAYAQTRQSVLNKYSRAKDYLLTDSGQLYGQHSHHQYKNKKSVINQQKNHSQSPLKITTNNRYQIPISSVTTNQFDKTIRLKTSPNSSQRLSPTTRHNYSKVSTLLPPRNSFDSPINARYPPDEFEPPLENHHRVKLEQLRQQENSTDYSINRIKQQIQKSRKLIQQFQIKNKHVSETTFD